MLMARNKGIETVTKISLLQNQLIINFQAKLLHVKSTQNDERRLVKRKYMISRTNVLP